MKDSWSRRRFIQSGVLVTAASAASHATQSFAQVRSSTDDPLPIQLGLASYTFRNFNREELIGFMKRLNIAALNAKNVKDHLPDEPREEARAMQDYAAAGIKLHAAGAIYFSKDEDADIRSKFEYCKRAGISVIVAGGPATRDSSTTGEVRQRVRHQNRDPQPRPGGQMALATGCAESSRQVGLTHWMLHRCRPH